MGNKLLRGERAYRNLGDLEANEWRKVINNRVIFATQKPCLYFVAVRKVF